MASADAAASHANGVSTASKASSTPGAWRLPKRVGRLLRSSSCTPGSGFLLQHSVKNFATTAVSALSSIGKTKRGPSILFTSSTCSKLGGVPAFQPDRQNESPLSSLARTHRGKSSDAVRIRARVSSTVECWWSQRAACNCACREGLCRSSCTAPRPMPGKRPASWQIASRASREGGSAPSSASSGAAASAALAPFTSATTFLYFSLVFFAEAASSSAAFAAMKGPNRLHAKWRGNDSHKSLSQNGYGAEMA
mmetsp:Transcript_103174/g.290281  ORF Transcript_103174/g.290281 Transcript_103174/m.290281 type:complete len:252 (-) Transcript_103174:3-758(-)